MVGDSVFPGQSVAAVALGGLRVAAGVMAELSPDRVADLDQPSLTGIQTRAEVPDLKSAIPEPVDLSTIQR